MKFVSYEKMSKKQRRAIDRAQRGTWGAFSPVTRVKQSPRQYDRKKWKWIEAE